MSPIDCSTSPLRVALVGAGEIATSAHLPAWLTQTQGRVVFVVDTRPGRAAEVAKQFDIPRWSTSFDEILERDDIDAIDICLPASLHVTAAGSALLAGKHVLLEKPFVTNLDDAVRLAQTQAQSGRVLMIAENWPYSSAYRAAAELLASGDIGEIFMVRARHESDYYAAASLPARLSADQACGGYAMSAGIHTLNLARIVMGDFDTIMAYSVQENGDGLPFIDRDVAIAGKFVGGGVASIGLTGRSRHMGERNLEFAFFGTEGHLEVDILRGRVIQTANGHRTSTESLCPSLGYAEEIEHFCACIHENQTPVTGVADQARSLAVALAVYRSISSGQPVRPGELLAEAQMAP